MDLMRVLQQGLKLQTKDGALPTDDTICGSMAQHFKVSPSGSLSFYQTGDADGPAADRIALGVMLAKLVSRRSNNRLDDVDACLVSADAINETGVKAYKDGNGETPLQDVNLAHWAVDEVTIGRLAKIVVATLTPEYRDSFISRYVITRAFDKASAAGELAGVTLDQQSLDDLEAARKHKAYRRLVQAEQAARNSVVG